jgi:hypothetical protein
MAITWLIEWRILSSAGLSLVLGRVIAAELAEVVLEGASERISGLVSGAAAGKGYRRCWPPILSIGFACRP